LSSDHLGRDVCVNFVKTIFQILCNDVIDNIYKFNLTNVYTKNRTSTVKEISKLKSQDSRTSECLRFTGPTKKSEKKDQLEPF